MQANFVGLSTEALTGLLGIGVPALWAAFEYRKAQNWKRAEFAAELMKEFSTHPRVRTAQMLLWGERKVVLTPGEEAVEVADKTLTEALLPLPQGASYGPVQLEIRHCFDSLLSRIQTMDHHVASGLLSISNVAHYLAYTCGLLVGKDPARPSPSVLQSAVAEYARKQSFEGVLEFARRIRKHAPHASA